MFKDDTHMYAVCTDQDITLHMLPIFEDGSGGHRVRIGHAAAGSQNHRHAFSRGRRGAALQLLVETHTVDQVPGVLPELIRLRQVNVP